VLTLRFFARVRDQLDCARMELPWESGLTDLRSLEGLLVARGGERWARTLAEDNLVRAVNQVVVDADASIADGDEIAFFPPVTGG
jgi:molybdopterin synthase sulfur carrier subunit